jgi:osmotically-inducible protein OsmY
MIAFACELHEDQPIEIECLTVGDHQIHAAVSAAFAASKYIPLRQLHCRVAKGVVEISGTVSSFYLKQLAQAAVLRINAAGVLNLIQVRG